MASENDENKQTKQGKNKGQDGSQQRPTMHKGKLTTFSNERAVLHPGRLLNEGTEVDIKGKKPVG